MARTPLLRALARALAQTGGPQARLDRRAAVKLGAGALAAAAVPLTRRGFAAPLGPGPRIAIVGAGAAGLTAAYRLMKAGVACTVYEAARRVGGRMYTERRFNAEGMYCERGGELVDSGHADLIQLCGELGVGIEEFAPGDAGLLSDVFYAGGRVRSEAEVVAAFAPLAKKLTADRALLSGPDGSPATPTYDSPLARQPAVQALDRMPLAAYLESAGLDGWMRELIDIAYVGEFGLETAAQSALNLVTLLTPDTARGFHIFGDSDESRRIKGGSDALPTALLATLGSAVPVVYGSRLVRLKNLATGVELTFAADGGRTTAVVCDVAIIAVPFSILRDVEGLGTLGLSPVTLRCIRELGYGTNAKLMVGFRSRFWRTGAPLKSNGTMITTLPSQAFWDSSRLQPGNAGILTSFRGGRAGAVIGPGYLDKMVADVARIFPGAAAQADGNAALQVWVAAPLARGSYTCQAPGQYTSLWGAGRKPELDGRLIFCGEHCSVDFGGYMNGAVATGNAAAHAVLSKGDRGAAVGN